MSEATFTIVYDGPALRDHSMDVRDLAPAMLGLGELFDAANSALTGCGKTAAVRGRRKIESPHTRKTTEHFAPPHWRTLFRPSLRSRWPCEPFFRSLLNGDNARIKVQVKATEPGCFQITFEVIQTIGAQLVSLLSGPSVTAAANLVGLIVGVPAGTVGLWSLIKRMRGGKFDAVRPLAEDTVRLTIGAEEIDIPLALLRLYQDVAVRAATQKVIEEPLKKDGVDSFEARRGTTISIKISKSEAASFARPEIPDATLVDDTRRSAFSIISLAFKEDNKWRLNDGTNAISATIEDAEFLSRVDANQISFSKGDILVCDVKVVQKQTGSGLKTEYTVVRVIEHRPAARQLPLPL